jgi:hypothetical protein
MKASSAHFIRYIRVKLGNNDPPSILDDKGEGLRVGRWIGGRSGWGRARR